MVQLLGARLGVRDVGPFRGAGAHEQVAVVEAAGNRLVGDLLAADRDRDDRVAVRGGPVEGSRQQALAGPRGVGADADQFGDRRRNRVQADGALDAPALHPRDVHDERDVN